MNSEKLMEYINLRNGELCADEILKVTDTSENPQINHIVYENNIWNMWDVTGTRFTFIKRDW